MSQVEGNVTSIIDARLTVLEAVAKDLKVKLLEKTIESLNHEMAHMATMSNWFAERHPRLVIEIQAAQAQLKELNAPPGN